MTHDPLGLLSASSRAGESSVIRDLLEHAKRPGVISMAGGIPDPALFPVAEIAAAVHRTLDQDGAACLQYGLTPGELSTRMALETIVGRTVDPERVIVTTGSQQGLDLLTKVLVDDGDVVVVGDPSYLGALQAFRSHGARLAPVPVDEAGLVVDAIADRLEAGLRPSFVYTVSNFQNPTGVTLSSPRRTQLVALAEQYGFLVVEDDPYGMLRYDGVMPAELGPGSEHVVRMRSVSKVLAPGLRIGWTEAPSWLIEALVIAKQSADLHTSTLSQAVVSDLLGDRPWFEAHVEAVRRHYGLRRDALCEALNEVFGDRVSFVRPEGGMFVWARVDGVDTTSLLPKALEHGMAYVPASAFVVEHQRPDELRLSFATVEPDRLLEAVTRLRAAAEV